MSIQYRDATQSDFVAMLHDIREADAKEWQMASGSTPEEHAYNGTWQVTQDPPKTRTRVAEDADGPLLLYGVNPGPVPSLGWVWLIACNRAEKHVIEFHRAWDAEVALLHDAYMDLVTASWVGNQKHHLWLKWIGFEALDVPRPAGPYGALFQPYIYQGD